MSLIHPYRRNADGFILGDDIAVWIGDFQFNVY